MFKGYAELNELSPNTFLNWEKFDTMFDNSARALSQYEKGLKVGNESRYVFISCYGTWGARGKDGSQTTSHEGIGYHANTKDLLRGFIDSGVAIVVFRHTMTQHDGEWIQGEPQAD